MRTISKARHLYAALVAAGTLLSSGTVHAGDVDPGMCPGNTTGTFHGLTTFGAVVPTGPYPITDIVSDNAGGAYVCGNFSSIGGTPANSIAHWDGTTWTPLVDPTGAIGLTGLGEFGCQSLAIGGWAGYLYVAGEFDGGGSTPSRNVIAWDGTDWIPMPNRGVNGLVRDVAPLADGVHITGNFDELGDGTPLPVPGYLMKLYGAGLWTTPMTPSGINEGFAIADWQSESRSYVGGNFASAFGHTCSQGLTHSPFSAAPAGLVEVSGGPVLDLQVAHDGTGEHMFVAGGFDEICDASSGCAPSPGLALFDAAGVATSIGTDSAVWDLEPQPNTFIPVEAALVAAGGFSNVDAASSNGLAWLGPDSAGTVDWWPLGTGAGIGPGGVAMATAFVVDQDESAQHEKTCLMIGGSFSSLETIPAANIGAFCCESEL